MSQNSIEERSKMYFRCYRELLLRHSQGRRERRLVVRVMDRLIEKPDRNLELKTLRLLPKSPTPLHCILLCMVYFAIGRYGSGYELVDKALTMNPDFVPALNILSEVRILESNFSSAIAVLERSIQLDPDQFQSRHLLGEIYRNSGQYEKALQVLDPLRTKTPENPSLWIWLRECHQALGTIILFENHILDAVETFPDCFVVWFQLVYHYLDISRLEDALRAFKRADRLMPNDASILTNIGSVHQRLGEFEVALQFFRRATTISPDHASAWANLVSALFLLDRQDAEYHNALARVVELDPNIMDTATYYRLDDGVGVDSTYRGN